MKVAGINLNGIKKNSSIRLIENQNLSTFSETYNICDKCISILKKEMMLKY